MLAAEGAVSSARERKGSGVTPNGVSPGAIRAPAVEEALRQAATLLGWGEARQDIQAGSVCDLVPNDMERLGRLNEIAAAAAYMASRGADDITGAVLRIDGGTIRSVGEHG
jgi:NAD(P)-dependent dehydrogenase (short-subunit alcohol dehydrogenase family)